MKLVSMRELAHGLGISIRTFQSWVEKNPKLGVWKVGKGRYGGSWWIDVERFAGLHGISLIDAYMLGSSRWIKAVELAKLSGISRKTIANWCRDRPRFAKRLGRVYYIDLQELGASEDEAMGVLDKLGIGNSGSSEDEEG